MGKFTALATLKDVKMQGGKQDTHEHVELRLPFAADLDVGPAQALLEHGTPYLGEEMELELHSEATAGRPFVRTVGWGHLSRLAMAATEDALARVALEFVVVVELNEVERLFLDLLPQRAFTLRITGRLRQPGLPLMEHTPCALDRPGEAA